MSTTAAAKTASLGTRAKRNSVSQIKIVEVATQMFSEKGYAAISIRDIAHACDVTIPSIYHYFSDKAGLYDRCCAHAFRHVSAILHQKLEAPGTAQQRLKRFTVALCDLILNEHQFRRILQREMLLPQSRRFRSLTENHFTGEYKMLVPAVAEITDKRSAPELAFSIYAMVFGLISLETIAQFAGAKIEMHQSAQKLADYVLKLLFPDQRWSRVCSKP
ncbi:MAG: TetR/AcrR family transcriptional regulator [Panacagrimonas sp.]